MFCSNITRVSSKNNCKILRLFHDVGFPTKQQSQKWTKVSHKLSPPPPSRSFSTSSASSSSLSQIGFLGWYLGQLKSRPIITKSITCSLIYTASDLTAQMITLPPSGSYDPMRTSRMAAYGLFILGFAQHKWFTFISKALPKRDVLATLKKLVMGQAIYGPCMTTVFFSFNAALQGENSDEIVARLKRDMLPTLKNGICYWPICDFVVFKFVPVQLQPLASNSCAFLWTIYLSYMASLNKVSIV
ncbi:Mpv17_PMP22 domain-containing protein [Cephalotus follicularis]|uniref:Mpv17_PMP22 domain-containing protein n=1 Tax=Cephalotus follicularis TaxID=3775 RepID=A0A1Q3D8L9_CEPFO|nr:Mpv17_PMP22 domain-containing protein [Cephalotus follicularis]